MAGSIMKVTAEQRDLAQIETTSARVACDGGGGPLGHPLTYYEIGADGKAVCGYCGKIFITPEAAAREREAASS